MLGLSGPRCNLCIFYVFMHFCCELATIAKYFSLLALQVETCSSESSGCLSFWLMVAEVLELVWHCLGLLSNITLLPRCRLTASPAAHSHTRARSHPCHSSSLLVTSGFSVIEQLKCLHSWLTQTLQKLFNLESSQRALQH